MRQHRGNEVSIENKLKYTIRFFVNNEVTVSCFINSIIECITIESCDSTTLARRELSTTPLNLIVKYNLRLVCHKLQ